MRKAKIAILEENPAEREMISRLIKAVPGLQIMSGGDLRPSHRGGSVSVPKILFVDVHLARQNGPLLPDRARGKTAIIALAESPEAALEAFTKGLLTTLNCANPKQPLLVQIAGNIRGRSG